MNNYTDLATNIGQVQTSNGVSFMIENAVFDGTTVTVSFAIETDIDLGDSPHLSGFVDVKGASGMSGTGELKKINENTYVGIQKVTPHFNESTPDELKINWEPKSITNLNTNAEITGDWQFSFKLPKLENKMELVNGSTTKDGVTFVVKSIEKNDMSTVIHYDYFIDEKKLKKWSNTTVQFNSLKDDLGNIYKVDGNGAVSNDNGLSFKSSGTIKAIDANAKSLTIVPTIYFSKGSGKGLEIKEMDPVIIDLP
ncbi:DUF4179 domain-containing protein [Bacillus sp. JJ722]|uniref:DUF4179 domain-containing protein n=1 Tax=Bacillus sp. JJ722 TaxID=3122973 RepID=UPI003000E01F